MKRFLVGLYGVMVYGLFFAVFLYLIAFIGNLWVPKSIDIGPESPLLIALGINSLLIALFAVQHTIMARPKFKHWITRYIPKETERSTFVLTTSLILMLTFVAWQPIPIVFWDLPLAWSQGATRLIFACGWLIVLGSTFLINHFDLFGLRQTLTFAAGRECLPLKFTMPGIYRFVRHPLYVGMLIAFWVTPTMTLGHLLYAGGMSIYILVGIQFEERDLIAAHGEAYRRYRETVPMLVPLPIRSKEVSVRTSLDEGK